jgi:hypothetical protein
LRFVASGCLLLIGLCGGCLFRIGVCVRIVITIHFFFGGGLVLAGDQCRHKAEVDAIMEALTDNSDQFEEMTQRQVLYLLWDIHRDARQFFSRVAPLEDGDHLLPRTNLNVVSCMVQGGNIMTSAVGVPELDFLGKDITHDILTGASGGTPQELFPGVSTAYTAPMPTQL